MFRRLTLLATLCLAALLTTSVTASAADRAFAKRFSVNDTGDITIAANTLMTCPPSDGNCKTAQNEALANVAATTQYDNGAFSMQFIDTDNDPFTTNSSTADLDVPAGATVLFAGLYWSGKSTAAARNQIAFKPAGGTYSTLTADVLDDSSTNATFYQGFKDVTAAVAAAGSGTYSVGNLSALTGGNAYGGWSLVVAYRDTTDLARNLTVFDGLVGINGSNTQTISVNGFLTPPSGAVNTKLGFVAYEGDRNIPGDRATFISTAGTNDLGDPANPTTNFFNSSITESAANITTRNPSYSNNLGIDADLFTLPAGYLGNSATSAQIRLSTSGDVYAPGVVTFATVVYAPKITQTKTVQNVTHPGQNAQPGDILRYTISGQNTGDDGATDFTLTDPVPANTSYVTGSATTSSPGTASYDASGDSLTARLGPGETPGMGGTIPPGGTYSFGFDVKVDSPIADQSKVDNTATATFKAQTLGNTLTAVSKAPTVTVDAPDLTIAKSHTGSLTAGSSVTYSLAVKNVGHASTDGTVTVTDTLPAGLSATAISGTGWTCTLATLTCTRSSALAAGASYPVISITADVDSAQTAPVTNAASVAGGGDAITGNNTAQDTATVNQSADLAVVKTADLANPKVGDTITYTLTVTNNGPSNATGVIAQDDLPTGLTLAATPTSSQGGACTGAVGASTASCPLGALARGASATMTVKAKVGSAVAGKDVVNKASVNGAQPDPTPANNTTTKSLPVAPVDLVTTKELVGAAVQGQRASYKVTVKNVGGSPASGVTIQDTLGAGLSAGTYAFSPAGAGTCTSAGVCTLSGTLAPGASAVVTVSASVASNATSVTNTAAATSTEPDLTPGDNTATVTSPTTASADLSLVKTADPVNPSAGQDVTYTLAVANAGPSPATGVVITDPLPTGVTFKSASAGCTLSSGTVTCTVGTVAAGASATRTITVTVTDAAPPNVRNTAHVAATTADPNPLNNDGAADITVPDNADGQLTKTASPASAKPGETVTYTLVYRNNGPATAKDVKLADPLPGGVSFASASAGCVNASGSVTCSLGDVPSGASRTVTITTTVDPVALPADHQHDLAIDKREAFVGLTGGQTGAFAVSCGSDYIATDGSVRTDDVFNTDGTRAYDALDVISLQSTADGSGYTAVVRNTATGQAQAHLNAVCVKRTTEAAGNPAHTHDLVVSAPVSTATTLVAGQRKTVTVDCGANQIAIAPSYAFTGAPVRVAASFKTASGWSFTLEGGSDASTASVSIRCLNDRTSDTDGHVHELKSSFVTQTVSVPAGSSYDAPALTCSDTAKGIVASYDLPAGLVNLGNDPQPKTRVFRIYNTTDHPVVATLGLTCLDTKTAGPSAGRRTVDNTATASSDTPDRVAANNVSTASFVLTAGDISAGSGAGGSAAGTGSASTGPSGTGSSGGSGTVTPAPRTGTKAAAAKVDGTSVALTPATSALTVPVTCDTACTGTATVKLDGTLKVAGKTYKAGRSLAVASFDLKAGQAASVKVRLPRKVSAALRRARVRTLTVVLAPTGGTATTTRIKLRLR